MCEEVILCFTREMLKKSVDSLRSDEAESDQLADFYISMYNAANDYFRQHYISDEMEDDENGKT